MNKKVYIKQDGTIPGHRIIEELERRGGRNYNCLKGGIAENIYIINKYNEIDFTNPLKIPSDYTELLYVKETDSFYENTPVLSNSSNTGKNCTLPFGAFDSELDAYELIIPDGYEAKIEDGKVIVRKKWSIKDAKDGDILSASDGSVFIYAGVKVGCASFHFAMRSTGEIQMSDGENLWETASACQPATQEEKDLLFQKIDEAGYEWDADKLELRKKKWQPKEGETVFYPCLGNKDGLMYFATSSMSFAIIYNMDKGTLFPTREEAQAFCDKLNNAIVPIIEERRKEIEG